MGIATYVRAMKAGQKEYKTCVSMGWDPYLPALEKQITNADIAGEEPLGLMSIPMELLAGTRTGARRDCFSPSFLPLLEENSEFAAKWAALAEAHLAEGIRDPITAVEYMNRYYVVEGNKRVSVLRYYGCPSVTGTVVRLLPKKTDTPEYRMYQEFLSFNRRTKINFIQFYTQGNYARLLSLLDQDDHRPWDFERRREFFADCTRFRRAFQEFRDDTDMHRDEALLRYLQIYGYNYLRSRTPSELKKDIDSILAELNAGVIRKEPDVQMEPEESEEQPGLLRRLIETKPRGMKVAFLHDKCPETSWWTEAHEKGRLYAQDRLGSQIETVSYFNMLQTDAEAKIAELAQEGYRLIFTTTPRLLDVTLRAAAKYPNVKFLNCSLNTRHPILRTYYGRMYEAKFLTGVLAGACSDSGHIGYICNYPVFGSPASINAFALGAQMVCPTAKVHLEWSTVPDSNIFTNFRQQQVDIVSGHDLYSAEQQRWGAGVFRIDTPLNDSLVVSFWNWGKIYERIISGAMYGMWYAPGFVDQKGKAINYWWGLSSNAVQVSCSDQVPVGTRRLLTMLEQGIKEKHFPVFAGPVYDQEGTLRVPEGETLSPIQIVQMDWLVSNVVGTIPKPEALNPEAQALVEISGVLNQ